MKTRSLHALTAMAALTAASSAEALAPSPSAVPVDSPWAIAGLGVVVAVAAGRLLIKRGK